MIILRIMKNNYKIINSFSSNYDTYTHVLKISENSEIFFLKIKRSNFKIS